jgi:hypothetical protein
MRKTLLVLLLAVLILASGCVCIGPEPTPTPIPEDSDDYPALMGVTTTYPNMASYHYAMNHPNFTEENP